MERKIGEVFKFEGRWLKVKEDAKNACRNCYLSAKDCSKYISLVGECLDKKRSDNKDIVFEDVTYKPREQPQEAEQPQKEIEVVNERKVGEVFEFEGKILKVVETIGSTCNNCYFEVRDCDCENTRKVLGACLSETRTDNKPVIFVEVKKEAKEHQEERPQKLNLCEILKDCPREWMFWSPMFGNVWFCDIDQYTKRVKVRTSGVASWYINADGTITIDKVTSPEIMLYPSRKQRDWSKFTAPWLKKERFDPKTLKSFDKVIFKGHGMWFCGLFSHIHNSYACVGETYYKCVIPYNDDTKHLLGTKDEAPDFYKYWED